MPPTSSSPTYRASNGREYQFLGGETIRINRPLRLNVSESGGHRIFDAEGISHYIPAGWIHLQWVVEDGAPNFVK